MISTLAYPVVTTGIYATDFIFCLGGWDAEMAEIERVLAGSGQRVLNKHLRWGAKASHYGDELKTALEAGSTPVLIELEADVRPPRGCMVVVDHHGPRAAEESSLMQVLHLLGKEPTHFQRLIAANDVGWIPAMIEAGASMEEVRDVRRLDWEAQGITAEMVAEAEAAYANAEMVGPMSLIRMTHSKCAPVTDNWYMDHPNMVQNILIISTDGEVNYYGNGALCVTLHEKFGGWNGGSGLGDPEGIAYWGLGEYGLMEKGLTKDEAQEVLAEVEEFLNKVALGQI